MTTKPRRLAPIAPVLPVPTTGYDQQYMSRLIGAIQAAMLNIENPATLRGGWLNISEPRFDCFNLTEGDVWVDGNVLKITRVGDFGVLGESLSLALGQVTVP